MVSIDSLERLRKVCGLGSVIALILFVATAVMAVGYVMQVILCFADAGFFIEPMDHRGTLIDGLTDVAGTFGCLVAFLYGFCLIRSMADGDSPFTSENVFRMKGIAVALLSAFVAMMLLQLLLIPALRPDLYLFDIPVHILAAGAAAYLFYLIFEYGIVLQTESDEFL